MDGLRFLAEQGFVVMKLYLIKPYWGYFKQKPWFYGLHGMVVRCESEDRCRQIAHSKGGDEVSRSTDYSLPEAKRSVIYSPWLDPEATQVTEIAIDGDEELILIDSNNE